jgi:hypothetical protein
MFSAVPSRGVLQGYRRFRYATILVVVGCVVQYIYTLFLLPKMITIFDPNSNLYLTKLYYSYT